jgi:hypothetical protein
MQLLHETSDDATLPCAYCVGWVDIDPDDGMSDAYPIHADGTRIKVLYNGVHPECQKMVDDYMAEQQEEPF